MKQRKCRLKDACGGYSAGICEDCQTSEKIEKYVRENKKLKAENAALRERLEKAVELPCIEPMTTWEWDDEKGIEEEHFGDYYQLLYRDKDGEFICTLGFEKEEAEARLAELKGEKK